MDLQPRKLCLADINLEKNPKDLANDAGKAVRNAAGDLSEAPSPLRHRPRAED